MHDKRCIIIFLKIGNDYFYKSRCCYRVKSRYRKSYDPALFCIQPCKQIRLIIIFFDDFFYLLGRCIFDASPVQISWYSTFCHTGHLGYIIYCQFFFQIIFPHSVYFEPAYNTENLPVTASSGHMPIQNVLICIILFFEISCQIISCPK